jgi:hypothetical protein
MEQEQSFMRWARTVEFPRPLRWGDVEAAVLSRPLPEEDDPCDYRGFRVLNAILHVPVVLLAVLTFGASLIGLGIVVAGRSELIDTEGLWGVMAQFAFLTATVIPVARLFIWLDTGRRRSWTHLLVTGATGAFSFAAYLLLGGMSDAFGSGLPILTLAATATGSGVCVVIAVASRGWHRYTPRKDRPDRTPEGRSYNGARAVVLRGLIKRGVVDENDIDVPDMLDMPLGSWHELDADR